MEKSVQACRFGGEYGGIRRTRQGENKCYTVMDELLTYAVSFFIDCISLLAIHLAFPS